MAVRTGNEDEERGCSQSPLAPPPTTPAVRDYLLARGIDPFDKPAPRPRPLFDPYEHTSLSTQREQIITVHPDYRRDSVGPIS